MLILITYDISIKSSSDSKRLRKIAKTCMDNGIRVQNSVFECDVNPEQWCKLKFKLLKIYDKTQDSLRFYQLGSKWRNKVEHYGSKKSLDVFKDILVI